MTTIYDTDHSIHEFFSKPGPPWTAERKVSLERIAFKRLDIEFIVTEAEVILPTFSRDKSILLLNCPLDA